MVGNHARADRRRRNIFLGALIGTAFVLIITIILLVVLLPKAKTKVELVDKDRIECPGFEHESTCKEHGCLYEDVAKGPKCYMDKKAFGYKIRSSKYHDKGMNLLLERESKMNPYGESFSTVLFEVTYITKDIVRFKLTDNLFKRYEVPAQNHFPLLKQSQEVSSTNYEIHHSNESFKFQILRRSNGAVLWDTTIGGLVLGDQFLQMASYLPSKNMYGLGEHVHETLRHDMDYKTWPMFSRDRFPEGGQKNLYGVHPFYLCVEKDKKSHGVLLLNSNAMEATLMPAPAISFRTIGGVLDFFLIVGDNPEHVTQLYTSLVGRPVMPPYWALGFQLSRYGYNNLENVKTAINRTRSAGIVQEVHYLDIDHFEGNKDFTYDKQRFADLPQFIAETKKDYGLKWIIILDPAIPAASNYDVYEQGVKKKVYVERSPSWPPEMFPEHVRNETAVYGRVWPAEMVAFPNFFRDETADWWKESIVKYHDTLAFDGLWIDMNEPASFETNSDNPFYCDPSWNPPPPEKCWSLKCPVSARDDPPYNPLKSSGTPRLSTMTLCMESEHMMNHDTDTFFKHYDVHSLYGWSQSIPTIKAAVQATGTRSVVISRSTFPSSGQFVGHWLGDNRSIWPDMHRSIIGMLEFNLFGIPYIGADVCGFNGDTTPEMCKRWMQLGAFYPFFRNHNGNGQKDQDPAALGQDVTVASKDAVDRRIRLNPYLYTLFYRAHTDGSTVVRPVFHEFPEDEIALNLDTQFMWGSSLLITPILKEGLERVTVYLPNDEWWLFLYEETTKETVSGAFTSRSSTEKYIPLHVRGGTILPIGAKVQGPESKRLSNSDIQLYVFPKKDEAKGELFVDDGISNENIETRPYFLFSFEYQKCSLKIDTTVQHTSLQSPSLDSIFVFGVGNVESVYDDSHKVLRFYMDNERKVLKVFVEDSMTSVESITWSNASGECDML